MVSIPGDIEVYISSAALVERRLCGASSLGSLLSGATSANTSTLSKHKRRLRASLWASSAWPPSTAASGNLIARGGGSVTVNQQKQSVIRAEWRRHRVSQSTSRRNR